MIQINSVRPNYQYASPTGFAKTSFADFAACATPADFYF
jgi:hypothetical protein